MMNFVMWVLEKPWDLRKARTESCFCGFVLSSWVFWDVERAVSKGSPHEFTRNSTVKDNDWVVEIVFAVDVVVVKNLRDGFCTNW